MDLRDLHYWGGQIQARGGGERNPKRRAPSLRHVRGRVAGAVVARLAEGNRGLPGRGERGYGQSRRSEGPCRLYLAANEWLVCDPPVQRRCTIDRAFAVSGL